jgi:ribosomal protein L18E
VLRNNAVDNKKNNSLKRLSARSLNDKIHMHATVTREIHQKVGKFQTKQINIYHIANITGEKETLIYMMSVLMQKKLFLIIKLTSVLK